MSQYNPSQNSQQRQGTAQQARPGNPIRPETVRPGQQGERGATQRPVQTKPQNPKRDEKSGRGC